MPGRDSRSEEDLTPEEQEYAKDLATVEPWYVTVYEDNKGQVDVESNLGDNTLVVGLLARAQLVAIVKGHDVIDQIDDERIEQ
jgi:hypothetical protein